MKLTDPNKPRLFTEIRYLREGDIVVIPHHEGDGFTKTRVKEAQTHGGDTTLVLDAWPIAWTAVNDTHVELIEAYRTVKSGCLMCRDESSTLLEIVHKLQKNEAVRSSGLPMIKVISSARDVVEGYCASHADSHFSENPLT